jgi:lipopolysaccharide biosynthesis glycosyltransferase
MVVYIVIILLCILEIVIILYMSNVKLNIEHFKYSINTDIYPEVYNDGHANSVVTLYTPNIKDYAVHSIKNMKHYCKLNDLTLYIFDKQLSDNIEHGCWNKIPAILYIINNTKHKYIIWMDIDAVFNRFDIKFNKFIDMHSTKDIIVCRDINDRKYKFNSGVMIVKNTPWSKQIFEDTWNKDIKHGYGGHGDQVIIKKTILKDGKKKDNYDSNSGNKHVALLSEREFNSYPRYQSDKNNFKDDRITDNDFIIHFMGHKTPDRIKLISEINRKHKIH